VKVLFIDTMKACLDMAIRAQEWGHDVRYYIPKVTVHEDSSVGDGMVHKVKSWESYMKWADLIVVTNNNNYVDRLDYYYKKDYPIFGCNKEALRLEADRQYGQQILKSCGVKILPAETFTDYDEAINYVKTTNKAYACKPCGDVSDDKALSYVPKDAKSLVGRLEKWKKEKAMKGGEFVLQKMVKGVEMAVGGWFGPGGWSQWKLENFEEKKLMNGGLGENTGEQGTILRYVRNSKLFEEVLEPVTGVLHGLGYVGYVDMNCIINPNTGEPWPLEFTMRFGWPLILIQSALHQGDPVEWMADLMEGNDTLKVSQDTCVGVVVSHGAYPRTHGSPAKSSNLPVYGLTRRNYENVHLCDVQRGVGVDDEFNQVDMTVTAGDIIAVTTGTGATVEDARCEAYKAAKDLYPPTNVMYRTDIGKRLCDELPLLQQHGYAKGMRYGKTSKD
jgi:phosphoribosylamine--glycine ligase